MIISKQKHWELKIIEDEVIICYNENPHTHIVRIGKTKSQQRSFHRLASIVSHVPNVTRKQPLRNGAFSPTEDGAVCFFTTCQVHIPWRDRSWQMVMPQYIGCCQRAHDESWWIMKIYDDIWWYMLIYDDIWWCMLIYEPQQHEVFWVISQHINHWGWTCPCLNMDARTNTHQGFAEPSPVDAQSGTVVIGSALLDGPGGGEANKTLQGRREQCTRSWYIKMGSG